MMGLSVYNDEDIEKEKAIQEQLYQCCDTFTSVVFNAGAGAGKTYALVECLKHIVNKNREKLVMHNQKIACITYTNVAANHIKQQIGASDVVAVSTIHERIWSIIGEQKSALLTLHIEKLKSEIKGIEKKLDEEADYQKFKAFDQVEKQQFFSVMQENQDRYRESYNYKAKDFKDSMLEIIPEKFKELISSVAKFKGLVDKLFKIERYKKCLENIAKKDKKYRVVQYDARYNHDRLDRMRISHDTVLEYALQLIEKYPRMRQMICDQYPYILIDEYQDTKEVVVKMMAKVEEYAKAIKHDMFVGYFGDSVQNIYDDGVGGKLNEFHKGLKNIDKIYNRRSYTEIINVATKIRNDRIEQKSIYSDSEGGSVQFYSGSEADVEEFIKMCVKKCNSNSKNPLHCMFANNQDVAKYSGFLNMYETFKNTDQYKGFKYEQLNTELLSPDTAKLGRVQAMFDRLMRLYRDVRNEREPLRNILPTDDYRNISFSELKTLIEELKSIDGETVEDLMNIIFSQYEVTEDPIFKLIIDKVFDIEQVSYDAVVTVIAKALYGNEWAEPMTAQEVIMPILEIKKYELLNWFEYRNRNESKDICYHTFHSTKGLEYENVAIILRKGSGIRRNEFETYFNEYEQCNGENSELYEKGRNVLYVAVTRAIKNLYILYVDNLDVIEGKIEMIFEKLEGVGNFLNNVKR